MMQNRRMLVLVLLLVAVMLVRWWDPLRSNATTDFAAATSPSGRETEPSSKLASDATPGKATGSVSETTSKLSVSSQPMVTAPTRSWPVRNIAELSQADWKALNNPFGLRTPPAPVAPVVAMPPRIVTVAAPPPPAPIPPPPLQVVGTWSDGQSAGVFVAAPDGTHLTHAGDTLMAQYKITRIDTRQVSIEELANKRQWSLPIPIPGVDTSRPMN